jgi:hypothetical protein
MRNQLDQLKSLFNDIRVLGVNKNLPNGQHTQLSPNITIWFAENHDVTAIQFGERYIEKVEIMKYSHKDARYKVSLAIDITDEELEQLIETITNEYKKLKVDWLKEQLTELETEVLV